MTPTFNILYLTRSALESRTHFLNSLIKIRSYAPAIILFEPLIQTPGQTLFLAKKISAYLSDNNLINTIITLNKFQNIPKEIPFVIGVPLKAHSLKTHEEFLQKIQREFSLPSELLVFTENEESLSEQARRFISQFSYQIISPKHKV